MEKFLFEEGTSPMEAERLLNDNCDTKQDNFNYARNLTPAELTERKDKLAQQDINIDNLEEEKKEWNDDMKKRIKDAVIAKKENLQEIRTGIEERCETVWLISDQDEGMMGFYSSEGVLVWQRPLTADERQLRIPLQKAK